MRADMRSNTTQKRMRIFVKKCLTNGEEDGIISKLSARAAKKCQNQAKFERIWKKFLTKEAWWGILKKLRDEKRKLGARHHNLENFEKKRKKFLTSSTRCDRITELLAKAATRKITSKKFEKARKKFLTNDFECDIIQKLSSESASVPCKLNNVKTNFNTLDN